jgi:preprotein translocase subunit SecE
MLDNVKDAPGRVGAWWTNSRAFLAEAWGEMKRVTWPSRREVWATTLVVILTSIFFGVYLWGVDMILNRIVSWLFRTAGA